MGSRTPPMLLAGTLAALSSTGSATESTWGSFILGSLVGSCAIPVLYGCCLHEAAAGLGAERADQTFLWRSESVSSVPDCLVASMQH